jgi:5-methylcytosine-specific restriction endonuclease McrA
VTACFRRFPLAASLLAQADLPEIMAHALRLVGKLSVDVHRAMRRPRCAAREHRDPMRMPGQQEQNAIFARDGWRCRFCGTKVICKAARSTLIRLFPTEAHWSRSEFKRHSALYAMASSLDHVVPHSREGQSSTDNFVTACYCCQVGRGEWLLEEVDLFDPRSRSPTVDSWDGLTRIAGSSRAAEREPASLPQR